MGTEQACQGPRLPHSASEREEPHFPGSRKLDSEVVTKRSVGSCRGPRVSSQVSPTGGQATAGRFLPLTVQPAHPLPWLTRPRPELCRVHAVDAEPSGEIQCLRRSPACGWLMAPVRVCDPRGGHVRVRPALCPGAGEGCSPPAPSHPQRSRQNGGCTSLFQPEPLSTEKATSRVSVWAQPPEPGGAAL